MHCTMEPPPAWSKLDMEDMGAVESQDVSVAGILAPAVDSR